MILKDEQTRHCRDEHIDLIKGFAIILVVFGHAIQYLLGEAMDNSIVFRVIYSFHMPLFIWVSGYTYGLYSEKFDLIWLWKRFKGFIIPFWMWAIIMWGLREAANGTVSLKERLFGLLSDPSNNGLWFLVTAFYCCLILSIAWQSASLIVKTGIAIKLKRSEDQKQSRTHLQKLFLIILIFLVIVISELDRRSLIHMPYRVSRW